MIEKNESNKRHFINKRERVVLLLLLLSLLPKISLGECFVEYLFLYVEGDKYGFMRADGKVEIAPQWEGAYPFDNGIAIVAKKQEDGSFLYGIINKSGDFIVAPIYSMIEKEQYTYGDGDYYCLCNYMSGIRSIEGIFDAKGKTLIVFSEPYYEINILQAGEYIAVNSKKTSRWGYVDESGQIVIPCQFDEAYGFVNGYGFIAEYHESSNSIEYALINTCGDKLFLPEQLEAYGVVQNDRFIIRTIDSMKYGLADISGNVIIEPQYDWMSEFENGIAVVFNGTKYGCILADGKQLLPVVFDYVSIEKSGIIVEFYGHQYIVDPTNMYITVFSQHNI